MPTININGNIRVDTEANWELDATIYSEKTILVTSDSYYTGTNQRKFKLADGVLDWTNLDYMPIGNIIDTLTKTLQSGNTTGGNNILMTNGDQIKSQNSQIAFDFGNGNYLGITTDDNGYATPFIYLEPGAEASLGYDSAKGFQATATTTNVKHSSQVNIDAPNVNLPNETASRIMATDSSKNIDTPYTLSTDGTLSGNSDTNIPSQKAVKTYIDNSVVGLLDLKGNIDASANPNYPSALKGDAYYITVAGKVGGASGKSVEVGDVVVARVDNAGGSEASVGTSWFVLEHNLVGALLSANNLSDVANASTALSNLGGQPLDSDLTAIANLSPSNDDIIQRKAGAWTNRTMAQLISDLSALGTTFQPLDSDLTTIAGLTATTDNFIQSKAGAWASRTLAQVVTDLNATSGLTGLTRRLNYDFTQATHTGDTNNTKKKSFLIPANTIQVGDTFVFQVLCTKTTTSTATFRVYINDTDDLTTPTQLSLSSITAAQTYAKTQRNLFVRSSTATICLDGTSSSATDVVASTGGMGTNNIDWTIDQYFIIAVQLNSAADTIGIEGYYVNIMR